jgi:hypothetical protein
VRSGHGCGAGIIAGFVLLPCPVTGAEVAYELSSMVTSLATSKLFLCHDGSAGSRQHGRETETYRSEHIHATGGTSRDHPPDCPTRRPVPKSYPIPATRI